MGDGTTYSGVLNPPPHSYVNPGLYTITLSGFHFCGELGPITRVVCIEAPLEPLFSVTETEACGPLTTEVTNNTDESNTCEVTYFWDITYQEGYCGNTSIYSFINGTDETFAEPEILFTGPGIYTLTLSATNSCGTESTAQNINVKAPPTINLDSNTKLPKL